MIGSGIRRAIVDIGSNSVRLVVYDGPRRAPAVLFNEKVTAGLGGGVRTDGRLDPRAVSQAMRALERFKAVTDEMDIQGMRAVATAAVRDASDGHAFVEAASAIGVPVELLSGEEEARYAGLGVISGIPDADGIVGDLGGGSLELVRIRNGAVRERISLPLGVLRLAAIRRKGHGALDRHVRTMITSADRPFEKGLPFYLVGGSWRALARLHIHLTEYPLPVLHRYTMPPEAAVRLARSIPRIDRKRLKSIEALSSTRIPAMGDAAALLATLTRCLQPSALVVSALGLREGLLFAELDEEERRQDPLIAATRAAGELLGRFPEHGDLLADWIAPLFPEVDQESTHLRRAACLLGDVAWSASPELRAERGLDIALQGHWTGVDARGRAMIAQALFTSFGGGTTPPPLVTALISTEDCVRASGWGLAMRLGQRLSGGVAAPLAISSLTVEDGDLVLSIAADRAALYGEAVERRHRQLASLLGKTARLLTTASVKRLRPDPVLQPG